MSVSVRDFRRALAANSTATGFTAKLPTATKPASAGVIDLFADSGEGINAPPNIPKYAQLVPYGTDSNDQTFSQRLWGWSATDQGVWIPQLLLQLDVTLGNIAATAIAASHLLADTIALAAGDAHAEMISPANDTPASVLVHLRGSQLIEFDWDMTGAASANCLWRLMDQP